MSNNFLKTLEASIPKELQYLFATSNNVDLFKKDIKDEIYFGEGYSYRSRQKGIRLVVPDVNRSGHFWCFGTTRVGKTRLLENMVEDDIRKGYDVIILDPKNDVELFSKVVQIAFETGRQNDLMLLNPVFPELSIKINPLRYYSMQEELVAHVMAAIPDGKEPFFKNVGYETTINAIQGLFRIAELNKENKALTFNDLKEVTNKVSLDDLYGELRAYNDPVTQEISNNLKKVTESEKDYFSKISSSLRVALMELTVGNTGSILGKVEDNELIKRLEENTYNNIGRYHPDRKGVIFVAQMGSLLTQRAALTVGKVLVSSLATLAGRVFASGKKLSVPLCVYIDEAQSMLYGGIDDVFAKAGGAGLWLHCFSQSVNQIYSAMPSKDAAKAIMDNTNTKLFMRAPDAETAESVAKFFGEKRTFSPVLSTNSGGMTIKENVDNLITPQHILELKPREFFMTTYSGMYRGMVRSVSEHLLEIEYPEARSN